MSLEMERRQAADSKKLTGQHSALDFHRFGTTPFTQVFCPVKILSGGPALSLPALPELPGCSSG